MLVALLCVLGATGVGAYMAFAAGSPPPAPTISSAPANPTNQTSASFTYTDSQAVTKFQCALDGGSFVDCGTALPSTKTYAGLAGGSHTFQVRAFVQQGGLTSAATSFSWVVDVTSPSVVSISRAGANPTNAGSVAWAVTFSEPVSGVDASDFALIKTGISGASVTVGVTGSGAAYTVTMASTGSGDGSVGLNVVDNDTIRDLASNRLGGIGANNGNATGQTYTIDKTAPTAIPTITSGPSGLVTSTSATFAFTSTETAYRCKLDAGSFTVCSSPTTYTGLADGAHTFEVRTADAAGNVAASGVSRSWTIDTVPPPAPVLTNKPDDPNGDGLADFSWTESESPVTFRCQIENLAFEACSSPYHRILDISNSGQHQFAVRAYDPAGNYSETTYTWKVDTGLRFTIVGDATGLLYPGAGWTPIDVVLHNPSNFAIKVDQIQVAVAPNTACPTATNLVLQQPGTNSLMSPAVTVPANGLAHVPVSQQPKVRLLNTASSQDACKNVIFKLTYTGHATK